MEAYPSGVINDRLVRCRPINSDAVSYAILRTLEMQRIGDLTVRDPRTASLMTDENGDSIIMHGFKSGWVMRMKKESMYGRRYAAEFRAELNELFLRRERRRLDKLGPGGMLVILQQHHPDRYDLLSENKIRQEIAKFRMSGKPRAPTSIVAGSSLEQSSVRIRAVDAFFESLLDRDPTTKPKHALAVYRSTYSEGWLSDIQLKAKFSSLKNRRKQTLDVSHVKHRFGWPLRGRISPQKILRFLHNLYENIPEIPTNVAGVASELVSLLPISFNTDHLPKIPFFGTLDSEIQLRNVLKILTLIMRRPEAAVASVSHSSASVPLSLSSRSSHRMHPSTGPLTSSSSSHADSGGWSLPPLNQFMTLPRRFMPSNFGVFMDNGMTRSSQNGNSNMETALLNRNRSSSNNSTAMENLLNEEEAEHVALNHFLLPPVVHYQVEPNDAAAGPLHRPEEIDLTFSSEEDEDGGQNAPDSSDVIEILDISEPSGVSVPICRKRRRSEANANAVLLSKRQHIADMMKSAESTNINLHNSEVVEEFKRRLKCSICLDVLEDMTSTLCGHIFCAGCIHQAIRASGKCPLCQRRLHPKDTHRLYF